MQIAMQIAMQAAIDRRSFLQYALAAPFLVPTWQPAPPGSYSAELAKLMRAAPVPGAVIGALHDYKLSWITPVGVRAEGSPEPITASTLFQAASLTKQVTAYVAFALRAQGKLDFDRPLVAYVDDLPNPAARVVTAPSCRRSRSPRNVVVPRSATMRRAVPGPIPGTRTRSSNGAVRISTGKRSGCARAHAHLGSTESGRLPSSSYAISAAPNPYWRRR